jgi:hypothetical protein
VKQAGAAAVEAKPIEKCVRQLKVQAFEAEIDAIDSVAQKELVALDASSDERREKTSTDPLSGRSRATRRKSRTLIKSRHC